MTARWKLPRLVTFPPIAESDDAPITWPLLTQR
jgi:hypothetical protein